MALSNLEHEQLLITRGARSGAYTAIAIHSTALGPALGGCRVTTYADVADAVVDALRLAKGMTMKAAAAGLDLGGGKGVICVDPAVELTHDLREAMLLDFADAVDALGGRYITAEDVGTSPVDMRLIATRTEHVAGLPVDLGGLGDPSPYTALGVYAAIRACVKHRFGTADLAGRTATVVGVGHVGEHLARMLSADGARVTLSDVDARKRSLADELPGASWVAPNSALHAPADVLAPCALGGLIDESAVAQLQAPIVCGAANNQLAHDALAGSLARREILYAPDFIVNAGGLIRIAAETQGADGEAARERVRNLEQLVGELLDEAAQRAITPLAMAHDLADRRLAATPAAT